MSQESIFFLDELVDVDELFELLPDVDTISPALPPPAPRTQVNRSDQPIWLVASPPPTNKSRCKRTTTKRKDEIEQLRRQVSELKIQLACTPILGSLEAPSEGTASYLWMNLSQRQENERRRAEEENGRLRQALAEQNKLIQSLRRVARTSKVWKQAVLNSRYWLTISEEHQIVTMLIKSVDHHLLLRVDSGTNHRHHLPGVQPARSIHRDTNGGYFYERKRSRVIPFSHYLVDRVVWHSICQRLTLVEEHGTGGPKRLIDVQPTLVTGDMVVSTISLSANTFGGLGIPDMLSFKTIFVLKRSRQNDRVVTAWESLSLIPESTELGTAPLRWVQRGWGDSWCHQLANGDDGCRTWATVWASITAQSDAANVLGEQELKLVQAMAVTLEESGRRMDREFERLLSIAAARERSRTA